MILSQWTSMLDLVALYLEDNNIEYLRFQGNMSRGDRDDAVTDFNEHPTKRILLMSLKCGGVGLTLTGGNHAILLDLAWSPATEAQAFDRLHRFGQRKEVFVKRLIVDKTVDSRLQEIQTRKQGLADGSLGEGGAKKIGKIGVNELRQLFGFDER